jgi:hypothetical protein
MTPINFAANKTPLELYPVMQAALAAFLRLGYEAANVTALVLAA